MKFQPYKELNRLIENETFELTFSWGLRMAVAGLFPIIWGVATNNIQAASWIALTAECICWVELKGSFAQRVRVLIAGAVLAVLFAALGSVSASATWFSVLAMLFVGFISGLFKNLGERGSGLSICVFVLFIISNAIPVNGISGLEDRLIITGAGGLWNLVVGLAASVFIPAKEPYRRTIALIWKANSNLVETIVKGWDGKGVRSNVREIYLKEKEIRLAIDSSFQFFESMAHQLTKKNTRDYQLAHIRKATALVAAHTIAISEELESIKMQETPSSLQLRMFEVLKSLKQTMDRMSAYVLLLTTGEEMLLSSRYEKLIKSISLLKQYNIDNLSSRNHFQRTILLIDRTSRLIEVVLNGLENLESDIPVYRSYSITKTLLILHPKHWWRNLKILFNVNTLNGRYAIRTALASAFALFIYKWFEIDHGYWIPFTVIIVLQPYFGATLRKAFDRVLGTIAGGIVGGLLLRLPASYYAKEIMLFFCLVFMVYFIRKRYSVAAFFVTVSLVILLDFEQQASWTLLVTRTLSTAAGAVLAIVSGFAILPHWDRRWLPLHISSAIVSNYNYFNETFVNGHQLNWTKHKRFAETSNSNAFDSFNRYIQEPSISRKNFKPYFQLITHNVRITRDLNNIHLEEEGRDTSTVATEQIIKPEKVKEARELYVQILTEIKKLNPDGKVSIDLDKNLSPALTLSEHQLFYLDKLLFELKAIYQVLMDLNKTKDNI
jgi:uncharacterized membrane protein YccC